MAQLWTMRVGMEGPYDERLFFDGNLIGLDWRDVGDVESYDNEGALLDDLDEGGREAQRERGAGWGRQAWDFGRSMETGDLVVVCFGFQEVVQVAEVVGDYTYNGHGMPLRHTRAVRWIARDLRRASLYGEVDFPFANAAVALVPEESAEARMRAFLAGKVRGALVPVPSWLKKALIWSGEQLWLYGALCTTSVLVPVIAVGPVAAFLSLSSDWWTIAGVAFALWLQVLAAGFRLIDGFADQWKGEHLRERTHMRSDLRPELVGVQRALQGHQWVLVPSWIRVEKALRQGSLVILGVVGLVRLAYGEPILRLFV